VELLLALILAQCAQRGSLGAIKAKRDKVLGCERVHRNVSPGCLNGVIIAFKWGIVSRNTSLKCLTTPFPEHNSGRQAPAWLTGNGIHNTSYKWVINEKLPYLSYLLPHFQVQPRAKTNGKGPALKGNRPIQKRKRPPLS